MHQGKFLCRIIFNMPDYLDIDTGVYEECFDGVSIEKKGQIVTVSYYLDGDTVIRKCEDLKRL